MQIHDLDPFHITSSIYILIQSIISWFFAPLPPGK